MIIDHIGGQFIAKIPRQERDAAKDMLEDRGMTYSTPMSSASEIVLTSATPWSVADLIDSASEAAQRVLAPYAARIDDSRKPHSDSRYAVPPDRDLWPYQKASLDYVLNTGNSLIADSPGCGKEQPLDEPVLTPTGWVPIGDLQVGDEVFSQDGSVTRVTGVFPQGLKPSNRVDFRDGTYTRCGDEHLWKVRNAKCKKSATLWRVHPLSFLRDTGYIKPDITGRRCAKYRIPLNAVLQFPKQNLPLDPYILGVLLGDGYICGDRVIFSNPDCDRVVRDIVEMRLPLGYHLTGNRHPACPQYTIAQDTRAKNGNNFKSYLKSVGLWVKSGSKFIPREYQYSHADDRLDLLRGLMDTDGSCQKNRSTFHSKCLQLCLDVCDLVRGLGGMAVLRTYNRGDAAKGVEYQVNVRMVDCPFYLPRKANSWRPVATHGKSLIKITPEPACPQVCISVAHPSRLYITRVHNVTHNTMQAIVYANEVKAKKILVICPAAIRFQWVKRINEWTTKKKSLNYICLSAKNGIHPAADYTVLSYSLARNSALVAAIAAIGYDLLIVDESHNLKDGNSQQTRAVLGQADGKYHPRKGEALDCIMAACRDVLFLSGTPLVNRPLEAYSTCRALAWDSVDYMSHDKFKDCFNPGGLHKLPNGKRFSDSRAANTVELANRMRGTFMSRHLKKDVMTQLKLPQYDIIRVEETKAVKQALKAEGLLGFDVAELQTTNDYEVLGHIAEARRNMGLAMAPQVAEYIETLLQGGEEKIVVFAWHLDVLTLLCEYLAKYGVVRIDGSTGSVRAAARVHDFCTKPEIRLLIGNIKSIGTGVDGLQEVCTRCVLAEPSWVPGDNQQAVDRLDRGGQKGRVNADFMVASGSLSEKILVSAVDKAKTITKVLD